MSSPASDILPKFRAGDPCPVPGCGGHLETEDDWDAICGRCSWIDGDDELTLDDLVGWMATRSGLGRAPDLGRATAGSPAPLPLREARGRDAQ